MELNLNQKRRCSKVVEKNIKKKELINIKKEKKRVLKEKYG